MKLAAGVVLFVKLPALLSVFWPKHLFSLSLFSTSHLIIHQLVPVQFVRKLGRAVFPGPAPPQFHPVRGAVIDSPDRGYCRTIARVADRFLIPRAKILFAAIGVRKMRNRKLLFRFNAPLALGNLPLQLLARH